MIWIKPSCEIGERWQRRASQWCWTRMPHFQWRQSWYAIKLFEERQVRLVVITFLKNSSFESAVKILRDFGLRWSASLRWRALEYFTRITPWITYDAGAAKGNHLCSMFPERSGSFIHRIRHLSHMKTNLMYRAAEMDPSLMPLILTYVYCSNFIYFYPKAWITLVIMNIFHLATPREMCLIRTHASRQQAWQTVNMVGIYTVVAG